MATARMKARDQQLKSLIDKGFEKRGMLRKQMKDSNLPLDQKMKISAQLQKRKRDESPSRHSLRCSKCGRVHGVYRQFELCRICIREVVSLGFMPGIKMDSW